MTRITGIMLVTLNPCVYLISGFYVGLSTYFLTITKLIQELSLESMAYTSKELKGLPDKDNPMNPVNRAHAILKKFLNTHGSFDRDDIQGYLNLFAFVTNPPGDLPEKVEPVIKTAFENPKSLRYRDYYSVIPRDSE